MVLANVGPYTIAPVLTDAQFCEYTRALMASEQDLLRAQNSELRQIRGRLQRLVRHPVVKPVITALRYLKRDPGFAE